MKRSGPRKTASFSESVNHHLNMYARAASAAGVCTLALAQSAEAKIVYTPTHVVIHRGWPYVVPLDLNHDGTTDFKFQNWWGSYSGAEGFLSVLPVQHANKIWGYSRGGSLIHYASALRDGARIGPKAPFFYAKLQFWMVASDTSIGACYGPWNDVKNRYLGLKFTSKGKTHFGWARLNVHCNPQNFKITAVLTGYAYETIPRKPIIAGRTMGTDEMVGQVNPATLTAPATQSPTLGALAMGAPGLSIWRR